MSKTEPEKVDYDKIKTIDEADVEVTKHKDIVCRKVKQQLNIKEEKKTVNAAYNEQLKEIEEEIDFEIKTIDALNDRRRALAATGKPSLTAV